MAKSNVPIYASIAANIAISGCKFTAAAVTGSSAMTAEAVHSLVDASDGLLLLLGRSRGGRPADAAHPFGHGREVYFWTLVVAIVFFAIGGGMSAYEGILHILNPEPIRDPTWNYVVLGVATLFDGSSWVVAVLHFRHRVGEGGWLESMRRSKDPSGFSVVLEDSADLAGIALAFVGVTLSHRLGIPEIDGAASIGVGLVLAAVAVFLAVECKGLLVGEGAAPLLTRQVKELVQRDGAVTGVSDPRALQLGPSEVLMTITVQFSSGISSGDVTAAAERIQHTVRSRHPEVRYLFFDLTLESHSP